MKYYALLFVKAIVAVAISVVLGIILLICVFAIPTDRIEENVISSVSIFEKEGTYPKLNIIANSQLDNWTDAIILLNAAYTNDSSIVDRAVMVYRPDIADENPAEDIVTYYSDDNEEYTVTSYARYWHGYLIFVKPLLMLFTYSQIRIINVVLVFGLGIMLLMTMHAKKLGKYIIPYTIALLLIDPFAISQSIQFTTVYYIYTFSSILFLLKKEWLSESQERMVLFFTIIGCMTSYFDFLTYPLATFGVPATLYLCVSSQELKRVAKNLVTLLAGWGIGYIGMWAGKWIIGTLLGSTNIIMNAINAIFTRSSMVDAAGDSFSIFEIIKLQLHHLISPAFLLAVIYAVINIIYFLRHNPKAKIRNHIWVLHLILCCLPFVWFIGASNHSYIHHWFTYRELVITAFSGLCMFARYAAKEDLVK